ncbi:MAG: pilus assembly protein [Gammaproteobacteria bacterium]|nr:pilus assembly protein [Gammaproteobacteria bacterium]
MNRFIHKHKQGGTAAVELAIVLPFLLLMMLAIGELGRAILQYNELTKSTRDAARYLANHAIHGSLDLIDIDAKPTLKAETQNLVVYGSTGAGTTPVLPGLSTADVSVIAHVDTQHVRVDVDYDYVPMLGGITMPMFGLGPTFNIAIPLRASVAMRAL